MKKLKRVFSRIAFGKRATGICLTLALLFGVFGGMGIRFGVSAKAAEEKPYYGDTPEYDGYYDYPTVRDYYALSQDLVNHSELYHLFNEHSLIWTSTDANSRYDYSGGYTVTQLKIKGRSEMAQAWKLSSFDVGFTLSLGSYYAAYKVQPVKFLLTFKNTTYDGITKQYYYRGESFHRGVPGSGDFSQAFSFLRDPEEDYRKYLGTFTAPIGSYIHDIRATVAETQSAYVSSWQLQNRENDTPLLWMIFNEEIFPVDEDLLTRKLLGETFKLTLELTPKIDPNGEVMKVTATCVEYARGNDTGKGKLGYEILPTDWQKLQETGKEWVIRTAYTNMDTSKTYKISYNWPVSGYYETRKGSGNYYSTKYPLTDTVGNGLYFKNSYNVNIELDTVDPYVANVYIEGDSLPATNTGGVDLDSWEDTPELSWADFFLDAEDSIRASVELNEQVQNLTDSEKKAIYLEWNVNDKNGNPLKTYLKTQEVAPYVNGNTNITLLVFEPLSVSKISPEDSGKQIKPIKLHGAQYLEDSYNNSMTETSDPGGGVYTLTVSPDKQVFFDLKGPVVTLGTVVKGGLVDNSATYSIQLNISDKTSDEAGRYFAGMVGNTNTEAGSFSIYSKDSLPHINYSYVLLPAAEEFDGNYTSRGTLGSEAAQSPSPIHITKEGSYILYLRIEGVDGIEIPDDTGVTLDFALWDILGNRSEQEVKVNNLTLDKAAPTASAVGWTDVTGTNSGNSAVFHATVTASDMNGVVRIDYKWASEGITQQYVPEGDGKNVSLEIPQKSVSGSGTVSDTLEIKVYDKYSNVTVKTLSYSADLSKFVPQYSFAGDPNIPHHENDILLTAPISTEDGGVVDGHVRVIFYENPEQADSAVYVGYGTIGANETIAVFDSDKLTWVKTTVSNGKFGAIQETDTTFLKDLYGSGTFIIWSARNSLAIQEGEAIDPTSEDVTAQGVTVQITRTSGSLKANEVTFGDPSRPSGASLGSPSSYQETVNYYKFYPEEFIGVRYYFSLSNRVISEWTTVDVDWENSYAVLLKANADGTLPETDEEVSGRFTLSAGINQCAVVPSLDKDGKDFSTGVYVWKVYIAQKSGGGEAFIAPVRLLLDAVEVNSEFGVYSYTGSTDLGAGSFSIDRDTNDMTNSFLDITQKNEDGTPLSSIDIGIAKPSEEIIIVQDMDGNDIYAVAYLNAGDEIEFEILMDSSKIFADVYLGEELGVIEGFRYWNANAPVDLESLPFEMDIERDTWRGLKVEKYIGWTDSIYGDQTIVVDDLSILAAAKSHDDFRLTHGKNRIAYQVKLTNGDVSNVMYFDLILRTVSPTVDVSFTVAASNRSEMLTLENGEVFEQIHTNYVTASINDYTSVSGSLDVYQFTFEDHGHYNSFRMLEVEDTSSIKLTAGSAGQQGLLSDYSYDPHIKAYFLAVDAYGNAVVVLPIIGQTDDTGNEYYKNVIIEGFGEIGSLTYNNAYNYDVSEKGRYKVTINHTFTNQYHEDDGILRVMDGYSVQVDDREPVYISALGYQYTYDEDGYIIDYKNNNEHVEEGINDAGIDRIYQYGAFEFAFPYDPEREIGELLDHTVTVRAYIGGEITDEKTLSFWSIPNLRPTMTVYIDDLGQTELNSKYTNLTDEELAEGIYYSTEMRFAYAPVILSDSETFDSRHFITTMTPGNRTVEFMDKYGNVYVQEMILNLPDDPKITISTTDPTVGPVIVTITSEQYDLHLDVIEDYENPENNILGIPKGTIYEGNGTKKLVLTLYSNTTDYELDNPNDPTSWYSYRSLPVHYGEDQGVYIYVSNIYNEPIEPQINWTYVQSDVLETYEADGTVYHNVIFGTVEAVLVDANGVPLIDPATGETPRFTFEPGGVTSYTFSGYENIVGAVGEDVTVTLPVTLLHYVAPPAPNAPEPVEDVWAPNVVINGSAIYSGELQAIAAAYVNETTRTDVSPISSLVGDWISAWRDTYGNDLIFTDMEELIAYYGWADSYRLNLDILDEGLTKIFITQEDYSSVPKYDGGSSDSIEGVSIIGKSISITGNASFVIHVVDDSDNAVSIPVRTVAIGTDAPPAGYVLTLSKDASQMRAYLTPPNISGVANLQITTGTFEPDPDAKVESDANSTFYGLPYAVYTDNGNQIIYYSYELNGRKVTGSVSFRVDRIDKSGLALQNGYPKWSANYDPNATEDNLDESFIRLTNQSITAQLTFSKNVSEVYFVDENGERVTPEFATVSFLGSQATVEYTFNEGALRIVAVSAANSSHTCAVDLPAVITIDKSAPAVFDTDISYTANGKSATITLKVNEHATLQSDGKRLERVEDENPYYTTAKTVTTNGEYTFTFVDRAGNRTVKKVNVTDIVSDSLTMIVSASEDSTDIIDPATYTPDVGDVLYVRLNRDAEITVDHTDTRISASADQWTSITIKESLSGLYPIIRAVDSYGNTAIVQLESVPLKDGNAPAVILRKALIAVPLDGTDAEIEQLLKANLLASDDMTPEDQLSYSFTYVRPMTGSTVTVSYSVSDSSGNTETITGQIRFYSDKELSVKVNGEIVERDETIVVQKGSIDLFIDSAKEPYKVTWKAGIKTTAQMKINAETLTSYTDEARSFAPDFTGVGYYTIVVTTQSQNTYRIILYVKD